jgi:hypothetical protein
VGVWLSITTKAKKTRKNSKTPFREKTNPCSVESQRKKSAHKEVRAERLAMEITETESLKNANITFRLINKRSKYAMSITLGGREILDLAKNMLDYLDPLLPRREDEANYYT